MKVVTIVTDPQNYGYRHYLLPSCRYHGLDLITLQAAERLQPSPLDRLLSSFGLDRRRAFARKDSYLEDYLTSLPPEEIIFFSDGYDTLMLAGQEEILRKFEEFNHPLIFSAEVNCHPDPGLAAAYPSVPTPARYLNSGGMIGRAGYLVEVLQKLKGISCPAKFSWSNQYRWTRLFLEQPEVLHLDYHSTLFFCAAVSGSDRGAKTWTPGFWQEHVDADGRLRLESGIAPCHLHFNGPISARMRELEPVLRSLRPWDRGDGP